MQIQPIFIGHAGAAVAVIFKAAFYLNKYARWITELQISVQHVALQKVAIAILRPFAPASVVKILILKTRLAAERKIVVAFYAEWNVFEPIPRVSALSVESRR